MKPKNAQIGSLVQWVNKPTSPWDPESQEEDFGIVLNVNGIDKDCVHVMWMKYPEHSGYYDITNSSIKVLVL